MEELERNIEIYKRILPDVDFDDINEEGFTSLIKCPFPHNDNGELENNPSAGIKPEDGFFNCFSCGRSYQSPEKLLSELKGITLAKAKRLCATYLDGKVGVNFDEFKDKLKLNPRKFKFLVEDLGFSEEVIEELDLGIETNEDFTIPVIVNGIELDRRSYRKGGTPKVLSQKGATMGMIIPYDVWKDDKRPTLICAGEKDMLIARTQGYNAICITGGELKLPDLWANDFKGKECNIVFDNDDAGRQGAKKLSIFLAEAQASQVKVIDEFHSVCTNKGGDIWDFFMEEWMEKEDLDMMIKTTQPMDLEFLTSQAGEKVYEMALNDAIKDTFYKGKLIKSQVQVVSSYDSAYLIPKKWEVNVGAGGEIYDTDEIELDNKNSHHILTLAVNDREQQGSMTTINRRELAYKYKSIEYPSKEVEDEEGNIKLQRHFMNMYKHTFDTKKVLEFGNVSMSTFAEYNEAGIVDSEAKAAATFDGYILDKSKLMNGKIYNITYRIVAHPLQKQRAVLIIDKVEDSTDSVSTFKVGEKEMQHLVKFGPKQDNLKSLEAKLNILHNMAKSYISNTTTFDLWLANELTMHSVLKFDYNGRAERGVVYSSVIGESRTGKSEACERTIEWVGKGTYANVKTSTKVGLIGGSKQVPGAGWRTTLGTIPMNHKGFMALEEAQGGDQDFRSGLTDIKSRGMVKIIRSDGDLTAPCSVRLMEIANQKSNKSLQSYANGIEIIRELVKAHEDVARYDFFLLVPQPKRFISPNEDTGQLPSYHQDCYKTRVNWVWSRKSDQVKFEEGVMDHIWAKSQELNNSFDSHVKLFGTETHKKIARLSVALAGIMGSSNPKFEKICVRKEHVDYISKWVQSLYDNNLFRLREYVQEEKKYSQHNSMSITRAKELKSAYPALIGHLESSSYASRPDLQAISGLDTKDFAVVMNQLTKLLFVRFVGDSKIAPSERFRQSLRGVKIEEMNDASISNDDIYDDEEWDF